MKRATTNALGPSIEAIRSRVIEKLEGADRLSNERLLDLTLGIIIENLGNPDQNALTIKGLGTFKIKPKVDLEEKRDTRKGKTLRKAFERPRPDLPPNAPENRTRKQIALTLPRDLIEQINQHVQNEDMDRSRFIEAAIRAALPNPEP